MVYIVFVIFVILAFELSFFVVTVFKKLELGSFYF